MQAQSSKEFLYRLGFFSKRERQSKKGQERKRKDTERESLSQFFKNQQVKEECEQQ